MQKYFFTFHIHISSKIVLIPNRWSINEWVSKMHFYDGIQIAMHMEMLIKHHKQDIFNTNLCECDSRRSHILTNVS